MELFRLSHKTDECCANAYKDMKKQNSLFFIQVQLPKILSHTWNLKYNYMLNLFCFLFLPQPRKNLTKINLRNLRKQANSWQRWVKLGNVSEVRRSNPPSHISCNSQIVKKLLFKFPNSYKEGTTKCTESKSGIKQKQKYSLSNLYFTLDKLFNYFLLIFNKARLFFLRQNIPQKTLYVQSDNELITYSPVNLCSKSYLIGFGVAETGLNILRSSFF